jgi:hypothetical protein
VSNFKATALSLFVATAVLVFLIAWSPWGKLLAIAAMALYGVAWVIRRWPVAGVVLAACLVSFVGGVLGVDRGHRRWRR